MKIVVTQEHIDRGIREECRACPIALAIMEALGWTDGVKVENDLVFVANAEYPLPTEAQVFVFNFDNGLEVIPFEFELEVMDDEG
jgi:hypothetical protein